jgi:glycosyltransferase involved in cell wall biosynthesis
VYANDLAVKAVLELSKERFFEELEFRFIGDGPLFEDTLAPLRQFENVIIEQKFLSRLEIADLHKQYGVFLCPSRMDTQGVSRDEAMSSGLVPITNSVAAIPEFVDDESGILAPDNEYEELYRGIASLYYDAEIFMSMSSNASERARMGSSHFLVIEKEKLLFSIHKED